MKKPIKRKRRRQFLRTNEAERSQINFLYRAGESGTQIADHLGLSACSVYRWLKELGVPLRSVRNLTDEQEAEAARLYRSGLSAKAIAKDLGVDGAHLAAIFKKRHGITIRSAGETAQKYHCRFDAFQDAVNNEEAAYWVGFLMADGCISKTEYSAGIGVGIAERDAAHLEKLKAFLGANHPIRLIDNSRRWANSQRLAHVFITSSELAADLARYGVVPRKSTVAVAAGGIENSRSFWRGCVDGDGYLYWRKQQKSENRYPAVGLVGSERLLSQFQAYCLCVLNISVRVWPAKNICDVRLLRANAVNLANHLYQQGDVSLNRKAAIMQSFAAWKPRINRYS